jgi:gas vesicle protein
MHKKFFISKPENWKFSPGKLASYSGCLTENTNQEAFMTEKLAWFLAGIGCGAVVGILYAPRSGDETREVLRAKAEEGRNYVQDRTQRVRDQAGQWVDRGREVVNQQKENLRGAVETGRQAYYESVSPKTGTGS